MADHLGTAYLRYSFTRGTEQETEALVAALGLTPGDRVLDVGCGPGRHSLALARRGMDVVGVDISTTFVEIATRSGSDLERDFPEGGRVRFVAGDARALAFDGEFDAAISLCQGAFGLCGAGSPGSAEPMGESPLARTDPDGLVLGGMVRAIRPGGRLAVSAFSSYFQVRYAEDGDTFDAAHGVNHERTTIRDERGDEIGADLWTTGFTPRELRFMAHVSGLVVDDVWSVAPGDYRPRPPEIDRPEFLLLATRP